MTAPPNSVTLDEMEAAVAKSQGPDAVDPSQVKLDGDSIPEAFRGKTLADVLTSQDNLTRALKTSEEARQQVQATLEIASRAPAPAPAPPQVEPEPEFTEEQIKEMYDEEPLKAIRVLQEQATKRVAAHYEQRLQPILKGSASGAEAQARAKYGEEFEVIGTEIMEAVEKLPDRQVMANPAAWDDIISYVRGSPGNFEKLLTHKADKQSQEAAEAAQKTQQVTAGYTAVAETRPASAQTVEDLDPIQKEIAATLGLSEEDYIKWNKVG